MLSRQLNGFCHKHDVLAKNTTVADAVLDRLAKTAYRFELTGDSMRK